MSGPIAINPPENKQADAGPLSQNIIGTRENRPKTIATIIINILTITSVGLFMML